MTKALPVRSSTVAEDRRDVDRLHVDIGQAGPPRTRRAARSRLADRDRRVSDRGADARSCSMAASPEVAHQSHAVGVIPDVDARAPGRVTRRMLREHRHGSGRSSGPGRTRPSSASSSDKGSAPPSPTSKRARSSTTWALANATNASDGSMPTTDAGSASRRTVRHRTGAAADVDPAPTSGAVESTDEHVGDGPTPAPDIRFIAVAALPDAPWSRARVYGDRTGSTGAAVQAGSAGPTATIPAPMSDRPRYYLTTAIAYANTKPGVHTLYEVIGADVIARWHRMKGDDTRFLTGTDEHSINIAQAAVDEGRPAREFVDEKVELFKMAEDALALSPGPLHPDDRPRSRSRSAGDGPPGVCQRRHLHGHVRGLVLPERGLPQRDRRRRDRARDDLPQPSRRPAPVADRAQLVLPAVRLPGAPGAPLRRPSGLRRARVPAQRDARLHPGRARGLLDLARAHARRLGHPVPDRRERRDLAARGRLVGPGSRQDLRLVRRADQLHHRCGLPRRHRRRSRAGGRPICT